MSCLSCSKKVNAGILCDGPCQKPYHVGCVQLSEEDFLKIVSLGDKVKWICPSCNCSWSTIKLLMQEMEVNIKDDSRAIINSLKSTVNALKKGNTEQILANKRTPQEDAVNNNHLMKPVINQSTQTKVNSLNNIDPETFEIAMEVDERILSQLIGPDGRKLIKIESQFCVTISVMQVGYCKILTVYGYKMNNVAKAVACVKNKQEELLWMEESFKNILWKEIFNLVPGANETFMASNPDVDCLAPVGQFLDAFPSLEMAHNQDFVGMHENESLEDLQSPLKVDPEITKMQRSELQLDKRIISQLVGVDGRKLIKIESQFGITLSLVQVSHRRKLVVLGDSIKNITEGVEYLVRKQDELLKMEESLEAFRMREMYFTQTAQSHHDVQHRKREARWNYRAAFPSLAHQKKLMARQKVESFKDLQNKLKLDPKSNEIITDEITIEKRICSQLIGDEGGNLNEIESQFCVIITVINSEKVGHSERLRVHGDEVNNVAEAIQYLSRKRTELEKTLSLPTSPVPSIEEENQIHSRHSQMQANLTLIVGGSIDSENEVNVEASVVLPQYVKLKKEENDSRLILTSDGDSHENDSGLTTASLKYSWDGDDLDNFKFLEQKFSNFWHSWKNS